MILLAVVGGTIWAVAVAVGGYVADAFDQVLEKRIGLGGEILAGVVVLGLIGWAAVRHVRQGRQTTPEPADARPASRP